MLGKMSRVKQQLRWRDNVLWPIFLLFYVIAGFITIHFRLGHTWDAVACWTILPFSVAIPVYYRYWSDWRFWTSWTICLLLHLGLMWLMFGRVLTEIARMGMMYKVPLELFGFFLVVLFAVLEPYLLLAAIGLVMRRLGYNEEWIRL
jgi:hypothetical protein